MRVLLTTDIFPPDIGGPATFVPMMASGLVERGHAVTVVTWSRLARHADDARLVFRLERIHRGRSRTLRLARMLPRLAACASAADVVFANGLLFTAWLASRMARRPMVAKVVGDLAWEYAQAHGVTDDLESFAHGRYRPSVEWRRRLQALVLRNMSAVVVPSAYLGRLAMSWGVDHERIHIIPNALLADEPTPARMPARRRRRLVTVGRLVPHKRVDEIIDVLSGCSGLELVVIGDGPERADLEGHARLVGCDSRVVFTGALPSAQVRDHLRDADAFVLNSRYEGLPHVVLEAFATGVPVVATAVGGTPELVRDGESGVLVPPGDGARLREAIGTVLEDPALRERLVRGGYAALAGRSPSETLDATAAVLARVSGSGAVALAGTAR